MGCLLFLCGGTPREGGGGWGWGGGGGGGVWAGKREKKGMLSGLRLRRGLASKTPEIC